MPLFGKSRLGALVVFAKAPVPGAVKTRLVPPLTPFQAADLHTAFICDTLERTAGLLYARYLACAPTSRTPFFDACAKRYGITTLSQGVGDLGVRMLRISRALLRRHPYVLLIGTDSPTLPLSRFEQADTLLADADWVFGPSRDGGYYLAGQRRLAPAMFTSVPWGTGDVLTVTLERLHARAALLPPWYDVDRPDDLDRLRKDLPVAEGCRATQALLAMWHGLAPRAKRQP